MRLIFLLTLALVFPLSAFETPAKPTLEDLMTSVKEQVIKDPEGGSIFFSSFFHHNTNLHKELAAQFEKDHPKLWKDALGSSGNLHNPKVIPLRAKFPETLRKTPTLIKIEKELNQRGYTLGKVTFEKFGFIKEDSGIKFYSIIYNIPFSKIKGDEEEKNK